MGSSKFRILPLTLAVGFALTGCLSSSDDSSSSIDVSGVVADGYLSNALVCLDLNLNKQCDTNEPQATTDVDGKYSFSADTDAASNYPVISVIVPGVTTDADDPSRELKEYVMSAPAGKPDFISPMTTMVQTEIESNPGIDVEAAEKAVKNNLGYSATSSVSLFKDYVAAKADATDTDKDEYDRIHKIAQVTARTLEENHTAIKDAATAAGADLEDVLDELVRLVVKEVIANMDSITTQIDDPSKEFNAETMTTDADINYDSINLEEDIAAEEAVSTAKTIDIAALLKAGLNWIESEFGTKVTDSVIETETISLDANNQIANTEEYWDWGTNSWVAESSYEDGESSNCQYLTANGLVTVACEGTETIADNGDGTATMSLKDSAGNVIDQALIKGIEIPLAGKRIRGTIDPEVEYDEFGNIEHEENLAWYKAMPGNGIFSTDAKGYRWNFTSVGDTYEIAYHEAETGSTCQNDGYLNLTTANCVAARTANGPLAAPTSLSGLIGGDEIFVGRRLGVTFTADAIDATTGTTSFTVEGVAQTDIQGTFNIETPMNGDVEILSFEPPRALRDELDNDDWAKLFLVIEGDYVRFGGLRAGGVSDTDDDFTYNTTALNDIKTCFQGGTDAIPCPVELKIRDGLLADNSVTFDTSKSMVPSNLDVVGTTIQVSTDDTTMRWTFTINADKTATFFSATNEAVRELDWKITSNGYLKLERTFNKAVGEDQIEVTEIWLFTTLSDGTLHLNRKRTDRTKSFGGYVTILQ